MAGWRPGSLTAVSRTQTMRAAAIVLLTLALPGCLSSPESVVVPHLGLGAAAVFEFVDEDTGEVQGVLRLHLESAADVHLADETASRPVVIVNITSTTPFVENATTHFLVDASTKQVLMSRVLCLPEESKWCPVPKVAVESHRDTVLPWAYGSTIFEGLTLKAGDRIQRSFVRQGIPATADFSVVRLFWDDGVAHAEVEGGFALEPGSYPFLTYKTEGRFIVSEQTPFVEAIVGNPRFRLASSVNTDEPAFGSGITPEPKREASHDWKGAHFPGDETRLEVLQTTFSDFINYSVEEGLVADSPGAVLFMYLRVASGTTFVVMESQTVLAEAILEGPDGTTRQYEITRTSSSTVGLGQADYSHRPLPNDRPLPTNMGPRGQGASHMGKGYDIAEKVFGDPPRWFDVGYRWNEWKIPPRDGPEHMYYMFSAPLREEPGSGAQFPGPITIDASTGLIAYAAVKPSAEQALYQGASFSNGTQGREKPQQ